MFRIVSHAITPPELQHPAAGGFAIFEGRVRDHKGYGNDSFIFQPQGLRAGEAAVRMSD